MRDFKNFRLESRRSRRSPLLRLLVGGAILIAAGVGLLLWQVSGGQPAPAPAPAPSAPQPDSNIQKRPSRQITLPLKLPDLGDESSSTTLPEPPPTAKPRRSEQPAAQPSTTTRTKSIVTQAPALDRESLSWSNHTIRSGDTLSSIFSEQALSPTLLHRIVNSSKTAKQLTHIKPGETLRIGRDSSNAFRSLILDHDRINSLIIEIEGDSFSARTDTKQVERRTTHRSATIQDSLYLSAKQAGLPESVIMELANIFGWDIDFALEIRSGDHFSVIWEEEFLNGDKLRDGAILAAEFVNQGRRYRALRYTDENGHSDYFTPEGRSMRKAFLRAPVDFRRISSRFTRARWHPVLGKKRPHRGVDYSAKIGTPIKAAGDGKIIHRGRKGGYGRTVIIQHGQRYTTLYAHLSRYNKKTKSGSRVKQGQIIGYVGKSGLATGPHLHYEFRVNGVHRNPLTVKLPAAQPIAKKYRADFEMKSQDLLAQLETLSRTMLADAN
jgi:murein DD-endopeptidase MepM/ murein hydrolase activator NlpD